MSARRWARLAQDLEAASAGRTATVTVKIPLRVDVEAWDEQYGTGLEPADVRDDVQRHVANMVLSHLDELGLLAPVRS